MKIEEERRRKIQMAQREHQTKCGEEEDLRHQKMDAERRKDMVSYS